MIGQPGAVTTRAPGEDDVATAASELVSGLAREPFGLSSPSVYETGRLVSIAPWLVGHADRVDYLLNRQHPDGSWGAVAEGYALVPTLSATEALFRVLLDESGGAGSAGPLRPPGPLSSGPLPSGSLPSGPLSSGPLSSGLLMDAVNRGLLVLAGWLCPPSRLAIPDLPAADLTVPALIAGINALLERCPVAPVNQLPLPDGMRADRLARVRRGIAAGAPVPAKLLHALEVVPDLAQRARGVAPVPPGTVGASPAATAAWLGAPGSEQDEPAARAFLAQVVHRYGGPVPCALPITVFERSWVLNDLARAGVPLAAEPLLVESLTRMLGPYGTPAGPGLPADADTTSVVLTALTRLGVPVDPSCLWPYQLATHFCTWLGEDGVSVSTNAHVLEAVRQQLSWHSDRPDRGADDSAAGGDPGRLNSAVRQLTDWLCERQGADGSWQDRWHASPYYATACAVLALAEPGPGSVQLTTPTGPATTPSLARAVDWVLGTQRVDGSWGRWGGTVEETAYALQILLAPDGLTTPGVGAAVIRGHSYLRAAAGQQEDPPLWHDKDLYLPPTIVRAATLSARRRVQQRPDLVPPEILSGHQ